MTDAHNHLQDERLDHIRGQVMDELPALGLHRAVVAGSSVDDWGSVAALARMAPWVQPSFGVHPWYVKEQRTDWLDSLRGYLHDFPNAGVGEIGLDRWIQEADIPLQLHFFQTQLQLAEELARPLSIHCLQAWGLMEQTLRTSQRPACGFLLHSYGGPAEMVPSFLKMGAYFSISPYFFHPRKSAQLEVFRTIVPLDRLLLETDAPDMRPPDEVNPRPLTDADRQPINDPRNITWMHEQVASLRGVPLAEFTECITANFQRLFGAFAMLLALFAAPVFSSAAPVLTVTRLDDDLTNPQPGMLRWALLQPVARSVVFAVAGDVKLKDRIKIRAGGLLLDGWSAPSQGVCVRGGSLDFEGVRDITIRGIRVRLGDQTVRSSLRAQRLTRPKNSAGLDCIALAGCTNVLIEHCSLSWSCDEILSVIRCRNVIVRDCILSEPLGDARLHPYGDQHAYPLLASASTLIVERCLFAHYVMRGPQFEANDLRKGDNFTVHMTAGDNVMFDFKRSGARYTAGVENHKADSDGAQFIFRFENNLFINKTTEFGAIERVDKHGFHTGVKCIQSGNLALAGLDSTRRKPWLQTVGCSQVRDSTDKRILNDLATNRTRKTLRSQRRIGGWPALK